MGSETREISIGWYSGLVGPSVRQTWVKTLFTTWLSQIPTLTGNQDSRVTLYYPLRDLKSSYFSTLIEEFFGV